MKFSVIIPTCNRPAVLSKCLDSIIASNRFIDLVEEIIVSDDSTTLETKLLVYVYSDKHKIIYNEGPKRGPAANRNNGASRAKSDWLIFIDDDVLVDKNLLEQYFLSIQQNRKALAFEGAIYPNNWELLNQKGIIECPINVSGGLFWSANICINKNLFYQIKGFDERFKKAANEDQDIYFRLNHVTNIVFVDKAIVIHDVRKVALLKKIASIPQDLESWVQLMFKMNRTFFQIYAEGVYIQFASTLRCLLLRRLNLTMYHLVCLVACVVLIPVIYMKL